jgi:type VI secretion system protein ImpG
VDRRLLRLYNRELQHLREAGGEFAREFPKIASRLGLDEFACADPYVERLLEGFAFLAARVQLKLEAEFPRFTQALLDSVYPHYLAPTPSMAIVQFQPNLADKGLAAGSVLPRGTALRSILGRGEQTPCEYRTAHDVTLWPVEVVRAHYYTRDLPSLGLPDVRGAGAGIHIGLRASAGLRFDELELDDLTLYLRGPDEVPMLLYEQLFAQTLGVVLRPATDRPAWHRTLEPSVVRRAGFSDEEALLPCGLRSFQGYRLLHEYFAFPQRYMFVRLAGLAEAISNCEAPELDIVVLTREPNADLEGRVDATDFVLFCSPAINLFPRRADRTQIGEGFPEFHIVADRTRPQDFEIYEVQGVTGYGTQAGEEREFLPLYSSSDADADAGEGAAYYTVQRTPRAASAREKQFGRRSSYSGSEVYVALVDSRAAPYHPGLRQLGVSALCTNRDLPLHLPVGQGRTDFTIEVSAPVEATRCIAGPTPPRPSYAEGEMAWRAVSHLSLNYLSLTQDEAHEGVSALRDFMRLYSDPGDAQTRKQIDGVKAVTSRAVLRRVSTAGPISFARGLEVTLTLDESAFEGTGVFALGAVMAEFFARYVSVNSFTETVVRTLQRGGIMRWPAKAGRRNIL